MAVSEALRTMLCQQMGCTMKRSAFVLLVLACAALPCNSGQPAATTSPRHAPLVERVSPTPVAQPSPTTAPASQDPDAAVNIVLKRKMQKVDFEDIPFDNVVQFLREISGTNIVVNWTALTSAGVDKATAKVNLHLMDATFRTILEKTLLGIDNVTPNLGFAVKDGVITISTNEDLNLHTQSVIYDVRDLASTGNLSSSQEDECFELAGKLVNIVVNMIDPTSWRVNGGTVGTVDSLNGQLVICQTFATHSRIAEFLADLRQTRYPPWEQKLVQQLTQTRLRVELVDDGFADAVEAIRNVCDVNIVLAPNVKSGTLVPLTLKAGNITLQQVLNLLARMEGLTWTLTDGVVYFSRPAVAMPVQPSAAQALPARALSGPAIAAAVLQVNADRLKGTVVTADLGQEIPKGKNVLWCGSFQLAWNELVDYAGGPVEMAGGPAMVGLLNQRTFDKRDIDDASVVAVAGQVGEGVLTQAGDQMRRKFPDFKSRLLPVADALPPQAVAMYACLIKQMPFEYSFGESSMTFGRDGVDGPADSVSSFGLHGYRAGNIDEMAMASQVRILWHRFVEEPDGPRERFIVELATKAKDDRLVLAMIPPKRTLADTIAEATRLMAKPNTLMPKGSGRADDSFIPEPEALSRYACLFPGETLNVPVLDFDIVREFTELYGKGVTAKNPKVNGLPFAVALQTIRFQLNQSGAKIESESLGGLWGQGPARTRDFTFKGPFLVMLMRKGSDKPYFAAWIANNELLVREPGQSPTTQPAAQSDAPGSTGKAGSSTASAHP